MCFPAHALIFLFIHATVHKPEQTERATLLAMKRPTIRRTSQARVPTTTGEFQLYHYVNDQDDKEHLALVMGDVQAGENMLVDYFGAALPNPIDHKLYFDYGTETADAAYEPYQQRMDEHLAARGYERGRNWITQKFDGAEHSERAWRERVHLPLEFLLRLA